MTAQHVAQIIPVTGAPLPPYVPLLQHRYSRAAPLQEPVVALPTFDVLRLDKQGRMAPRFETAQSLRDGYRLAPNSRVILISVATDDALEVYWARRRQDGVPAALSRLGLDGITVPNFSFFTDAPRPHTLWNRARMALVAREFTQEGLAVIPHLNAETTSDWQWWEHLVLQQPQLTYVAKEFQTGLARHEAGLEALDHLRRLQDRAGRELHPILIGAGRYVREIKAAFANFTISDSRPFMETMARRRAMFGSRIRWLYAPSPSGSSVDELLLHNVSVYSQWIREMPSYQAWSESETSQLYLPLMP